MDDVFAPAEELRAAGVELVGEPKGTAEQQWVHFPRPRPSASAQATTTGAR